MEIAGEDGFRVRSYRNGASAIESYPERISDILANPDRKRKERSGRFLLGFADYTARELTTWLSALEGIEAITPAGSLRRGRETIGDLDILVTGPNAAAALERVAINPKVQEVLGRGANKTS